MQVPEIKDESANSGGREEVGQFDWREDGHRAYTFGGAMRGWMHTAPLEVRHNALVYLSSKPLTETTAEELLRKKRGDIHPQYLRLNARRPIRQEAHEVFSAVLPQVLSLSKGYLLEESVDRYVKVYDLIESRGGATAWGQGPHSSRSTAFAYALAFGVIMAEFSEAAYGDRRDLSGKKIDLGKMGLTDEEVAWLYEGEDKDARKAGVVSLDDIWRNVRELKLEVYKECRKALIEAGMTEKGADYEIYDAFCSPFVGFDPETKQARDRASTESQDKDAYGYVSNGFQR
jgi:hypothetical protein